MEHLIWEHVYLSPLSLHLQREGCSYYYRVQQKLGSQAQLRQYGYTSAWDIEDLVHLGKRVHVGLNLVQSKS